MLCLFKFIFVIFISVIEAKKYIYFLNVTCTLIDNSAGSVEYCRKNAEGNADVAIKMNQPVHLFVGLMLQT